MPAPLGFEVIATKTHGSRPWTRLRRLNGIRNNILSEERKGKERETAKFDGRESERHLRNAASIGTSTEASTLANFSVAGLP